MKKNNRQRNILPPKDFVRRMFRFFLISTGMVFISLALGVLGYHYYAELGWTDSLLNASMILTGMGPVDKLTSHGAKIFASIYALFSGVAFLTTVAVFLSPIAHRLMHLLHVEEDDETSIH
jgi:hypothetical protein